MLRAVRIGIFALCLSIFSPAQASEPTLECNSCSWQARYSMLMAKPLGKYLVLDYATGSISRHWVRKDAETKRKDVEDLAVTAQEAAAFAEIARHRNSYPNMVKGQVGLRVDSGSAFDVATNATYRSNLGAHAAEQLATYGQGDSFIGSLNRVMQAMLAVGAGFINNPYEVTIVVKFPDGSTAEFKVKAANLHKAEYVLGTAKDDMGNFIPDPSYAPDASPSNLGDISGEHNFSSEATLDQYLYAAMLRGITIENPENRMMRMYCGGDPVVCVLQ